jgi:hypothetical protein
MLKVNALEELHQLFADYGRIYCNSLLSHYGNPRPVPRVELYKSYTEFAVASEAP